MAKRKILVEDGPADKRRRFANTTAAVTATVAECTESISSPAAIYDNENVQSPKVSNFPNRIPYVLPERMDCSAYIKRQTTSSSRSDSNSDSYSASGSYSDSDSKSGSNSDLNSDSDSGLDSDSGSHSDANASSDITTTNDNKRTGSKWSREMNTTNRNILTEEEHEFLITDSSERMEEKSAEELTTDNRSTVKEEEEEPDFSATLFTLDPGTYEYWFNEADVFRFDV